MNHYVSCKTYGYLQYRSDFNVYHEKENVINAVLDLDKSNWNCDVYAKAYNGNMDAIEELADDAIGKFNRGSPDGDPVEAVYWLERCLNPEQFYGYDGWIHAYCLAGRPEKALEIYPIALRH